VTSDEEFDSDQAERDIDGFITRADGLPGPPVQEIGNQIARIMQSAWRQIEEQASLLPNDKLIATMLLVSRDARKAEVHESRHWYLLAASTLLSGLISSPRPGS
jgi:hypothetical protein